MIRQFCFVMEIPGSERRLSGNKNYSNEIEVNWCQQTAMIVHW